MNCILGMIMLIVYVGAVAVLFLFVVMMLNVAQQKDEWFKGKIFTSFLVSISAILSFVVFLFCCCARLCK